MGSFHNRLNTTDSALPSDKIVLGNGGEEGGWVCFVDVHWVAKISRRYSSVQIALCINPN